MKEFLDTIKDEGIKTKEDIVPQIMKSMNNWIQRIPNFAFDQLSVWDEILTARSLYLDLYNFKFQDSLSSKINQDRDLCDIRAILNV